MATYLTRARLPVTDGSAVGVKLLAADGETVLMNRTGTGVKTVATGANFMEFTRSTSLPSGTTQGTFIWDDGDGHYSVESFNIFTSEGGASASSGGGVVNARIAYTSLSPDEYLEIIQGEEKVITFICEADGRFDQAEADEIAVKFKDPSGNIVLIPNDFIERVCEELDVQVFRATLTPEYSESLEEGLLRIEISFDTQKAVVTHTMKIVEAL